MKPDARNTRAEIIAVGTELLTASRLDTNSLFITRTLNGLGFTVMRKCVVGDRQSELQQSLEMALRDSEVVITIGGLGPTNDDITREVISETLGRELKLDDAIVSRLKERFSRSKLKVMDNNLRQAMVPKGAKPIENPNGSAPGLFLKEGDALLFLLPGPPRELEPMMVRVAELIQEHKEITQVFHRMLKVASLAESVVDSMVEPIYKSYPQIETTVLSSPGVVELYFYWTGEADRQLAERQLAELHSLLIDKLGKAVFSDQEEALEEVVGRLLRKSGKNLATAESCTGGLMGKMLTDVPGSSDYYHGGVVSYSNFLKSTLIGVDENTLKHFGAASEEVARQMAIGIREHAGTDFGLSITGIAGPEGGTPEKPVGLVFIGLSDENNTQIRQKQFPGPRKTVRIAASRYALDWLRQDFLMGNHGAHVDECK